MTPAVATRLMDERRAANACVSTQGAEIHQGQRRCDDDGGQRGLWEVGQQPVEEQEQERDQAGTDQPCRL